MIKRKNLCDFSAVFYVQQWIAGFVKKYRKSEFVTLQRLTFCMDYIIIMYIIHFLREYEQYDG